VRLIKTIATLTFVFWPIQSLAFVILFASSFTDLIVRFFITLGFPVPETSFHTFLLSAMKVLSWPVRVLFSSAWNEAGSLTAILLLAVNSLIWGTICGTIFYFVARNRLRARVSHS
jgi:hypothetical protein